MKSTRFELCDAIMCNACEVWSYRYRIQIEFIWTITVGYIGGWDDGSIADELSIDWLFDRWDHWLDIDIHMSWSLIKLIDQRRHSLVGWLVD